MYLLVREVTKLFAPGFEEALTNHVTMVWLVLNRFEGRKQDFKALVNGEHKFDLEYIGTVVKFVVFVLTQTSLFLANQMEIAARLKALENGRRMPELFESRYGSASWSRARMQRVIQDGRRVMNFGSLKWTRFDNASCQIYWHIGFDSDFSAPFGHN